MFLLLHRVKYRKKVPLGTGTEFQVPIPVPYRFKCERYPTLETELFCKWSQPGIMHLRDEGIAS